MLQRCLLQMDNHSIKLGNPGFDPGVNFGGNKNNWIRKLLFHAL